MQWSIAVIATWLVASTAGSAMAQIYTCVDAKGRKITSDRSIPECLDRPQQEITPLGTVKRVIQPPMTAQERAAQEEKEKLEAEQRALAAEEKRRDRALVLRYPNKQIHDKERASALAQVDEVIKASTRRTGELGTQRKQLLAELEFYKGDMSKVPPPLKRKLEENDNNQLLQKKFQTDQEGEKRRINVRFDEELVKLKQLWLTMGVATVPGTTSTAPTTPASAPKIIVKK